MTKRQYLYIKKTTFEILIIFSDLLFSKSKISEHLKYQNSALT